MSKKNKQKRRHETSLLADYVPKKLTTTWPWLAAGAALGSLCTLIFDPVQGSRRRALIRDKGVHLANSTRLKSARLGRDLRNRVQGVSARVVPGKTVEVDDETLNQRVRSGFGRVVSHARSIDSAVSDGVVTLSGPVLVGEVAALISAIERVPGVKSVVNNLDVHQSSAKISGLQGEGKPYLQ